MHEEHQRERERLLEGADAAALTLAVREALTNAGKHANADRARS